MSSTSRPSTRTSRAARASTTGPSEISADTGPGFAPEDLAHAFERFYLYDRYRSERAVGTGLGLAIVHELTAAMGGHVSAANGAGGGAVFTIAVARPA